MNALDLFNYTVGIAGVESSNAQNFLPTYLPQLNIVLAETFKLENNNRLYKGLAVLDAIPFMTALTDTIPYQDNVVRNVLPFGILTYLQLADDEVVKTGFYQSRYADNLRLEGKLIPVDIEDYYGGTDE